MPSPSRMLRLPSLSALLLAIALLSPATPVLAGSAAVAESNTDFICHTSNLQDCYPRIFEATDEFQKVHSDQELPKGLHVRLNIYTGEKEAKIYVPDEDDAPSLQSLTVEDHNLIAVESEPRDSLVLPKGAPVYKAAGKIKAPPYEVKAFSEGMSLLRSAKGDDEPGFDAAMEGLEDVAHDLYYGFKVAEDTDVVKALLCRMAHTDKTHAEGFPPRDQQAAAIVIASLHNNPTALAEVTRAWTGIMDHRCPADNKPLRSTLYQSVAPLPAQKAAERRVAASRSKTKVVALSSLVRDPVIQADFLQHDGMRELVRVLMPEDKEWAVAQRQVGYLVSDNFLDEDMGARTGLWPTGPRLSDEECRKEEWRTAEGCWDYNVDRIARANKDDKEHWSKDLQSRLATARLSAQEAHSLEL